MFSTIPPPRQRLLVFARLPEPGRVKTRLARDVGDDRALAAYEAMLRDVLGTIGASSVASTGDTEVEVMWAPSASATGETLRRAFGDFALAMQTGQNLGERLAMAFSERFYFQHTQKVVAIGVDDPSLSRQIVDRAFALLDTCDWVVGPAADGGYYLIGCRGASFDVDVFTDVEWGTERVLAMTLDRIRGFGGTVAVLPERSDIDVADDLRAYTGDGAVGALLTEWGWR